MLHLLIDAYAAAMLARNASRATIKSRRWWLRACCQWLALSTPHPTLDDLDAAALREWVAHLRRSGKRPRTIKAGISSVRAFCCWLVEQRHLSASPASDLHAPPLDPPRREQCTDEDVAALLAACERLPDQRRGALALACVSVLAYTGLRRGELLALRVEDAMVGRGELAVRHGKGGKPRIAYLNAETTAALRAWLRHRGECRHPYLLDYDHARRLADAGLRTLLREVAAVAGRRGNPACLPHSLRHWYATRLLRQGVDLETIRESLGHSSLQVTQCYLHSGEEQRRAAADRAALRAEPEPEPQPPAPTERSARNAAYRQRLIHRA